jgi:hypothetical protein
MFLPPLKLFHFLCKRFPFRHLDDLEHVATEKMVRICLNTLEADFNRHICMYLFFCVYTTSTCMFICVPAYISISKCVCVCVIISICMHKRMSVYMRHVSLHIVIIMHVVS